MSSITQSFAFIWKKVLIGINHLALKECKSKNMNDKERQIIEIRVKKIRNSRRRKNTDRELRETSFIRGTCFDTL